MTALDGATVIEGTVEWQGHKTWYRVVSLPDPGSGQGPEQTPLVICHGGPGLTHDYLTSVAELVSTGRTCVLYDQVGNGRSEHHGDAPAQFWKPELFVDELQVLIGHLGIADDFHVLGHSWGGMLALELAVRRPPGLRSIVVADGFASSWTYREEVARLLRELPRTYGSRSSATRRREPPARRSIRRRYVPSTDVMCAAPVPCPVNSVEPLSTWEPIPRCTKP